MFNRIFMKQISSGFAVLACFCLISFVGCRPQPRETQLDSNTTDATVTESTDDSTWDTPSEDVTTAAPDDDVSPVAPVDDTPTETPTADDATAIADDTITETPTADVAADAPTDDTTADTTVDDTAADTTPDGSETASEPDTSVDASTESSDNVVELGSPELTAGIPGDGALTVEQIRAWLDQPNNHETLEIKLPMGLAAGAALIQGLDENPMTRAKIELGRQLYFDTRLSKDNTVSCASCHHPDEGYGRHTQFGVGIEEQTGNRNSPVSHNRILSGAQFWDGRAASLEEQAVGPIANPIEMGNTHEAAVETVNSIEGYRIQFEKIFGGAATIDAVGKAIAAFERAIVTGPAPYDYYEIVRSVRNQFDEDEIAELEEEDPDVFARYTEALKNSEAMSESARRGRELFFTDRANCTACHVGANFTDELYHNLGVGMDQEEPDLGRFAVTEEEKDRGAFKTPTLRNIALSKPYMHDGSQGTLEEVVEWYDKGGHPNPQLSDKIKKLELTEQDEQDLVNFMVEGLTSDFPPVEQARLPE